MIIFHNNEIPYVYETKYFHLNQIAKSGQVFRIYLIDEKKWIVFFGQKSIQITQLNNAYFFHCSNKEFKEIWIPYFDLNNPIYNTIENQIKNYDKLLYNAWEYGNGIRILNQDIFEVIISFLISQRKNISAIRTTIEKFCEKFGQKDNNGYLFPTIHQLKNITLTDLNGLGLGYRDKYIFKFIKEYQMNLNLLNHLSLLNINDLKKELLSFDGIGEKIANCILLFGFHQLNYLPIDIWMERILKQYPNKNFPYHHNQGLLQQYLFHYALNHKELFK